MALQVVMALLLLAELVSGLVALLRMFRAQKRQWQLYEHALMAQHWQQQPS